jgi:hypothetical protein
MATEANHTKPSRVLGPRAGNLPESPLQHRITGRYKPMAHCIRSGGLPLDRLCCFELRNPVKSKESFQ